MPTKAWHVDHSLEEIRTTLAEKLSREENGSYWAFNQKWTGAVSQHPGMSGFKVDTDAAKLYSHPFLTEKDAQVHALALLARHSEHENEISTLPEDWQPLVEKRAAEINAGKKPENVVEGAHKGSGKGYRVVTKSGGTELELLFTPPPDFTADGKKGLKMFERLKDTRSNRKKIEAEHAGNHHVQRREKLEKASKPDARRKFGPLDEITNSSPESSPDAPRPPARLKRARAPPQAPQLDATTARRGRGAARTTGGGRGRSTSRRRVPAPAPAPARVAPRRRAAASAAPRDDDDQGPARATGGGGDGRERRARSPPPQRTPAPTSVPAAPRPPSIAWPSRVPENPFSLDDDDLRRYLKDYRDSQRAQEQRPTGDTAPIFRDVECILAGRRVLHSVPDDGWILGTPAFPLHTPALWHKSKAMTSWAFTEAWRETDGGRRSCLVEALNRKVFDESRLGLLLTEAWAGKKLGAEDWAEFRPLVRVDLLLGNIQAVPQAVVFWPVQFAALFDNQHNKGGWQRWIGKARCARIQAAVFSPTQAQSLDERAGMADGPTV